MLKPTSELSPFQRHVQKWKSCTLCDSCKHRKHVVLFRGDIPCSCLFVGEAPGPSEDVLGSPFKGPAGKILDSIIEDAKIATSMDPTIGMTNLVGCIPRGDDLRKFGEPTQESIDACHDRLIEIIKISQPTIVVAVGKLAKTAIANMNNPTKNTMMVVDIVHPAGIMRADRSQQGLMIKNATLTLVDAFEDFLS